MLLAIDTATRLASLALYDEGGLIAEQSWRSRNNHSSETMPAIAEMLARQHKAPEALSGVAVAQGPGSFTGLRIGMSIAKGLCLGLGIPLIAIPTLDVMAYATGDPGRPVYAVLEAGRGRICVARYHYAEGLPVRQGEIELCAADAWLPPAGEPVLVAGEISADMADRLLSSAQAEDIALVSLAGSVRRAGYLAELAWERLQAGQVDDLDSTQPIYTSFS
jgi:tRNA threonylcarbamoyladenosine biosynthesis protein TsaB